MHRVMHCVVHWFMPFVMPRAMPCVVHGVMHRVMHGLMHCVMPASNCPQLFERFDYHSKCDPFSSEGITLPQARLHMHGMCMVCAWYVHAPEGLTLPQARLHSALHSDPQ